MNKTIEESIQASVDSLISEANGVDAADAKIEDGTILGYLSGDQIGALEKKYALLPVEIQQAMRAKYPDVESPVELYVLRQLNREANNYLASKLRPGWISQLTMFVPDLVNANDSTRKAAEHRLGNLADEIPDMKEIVNCLKRTKVLLDLSSKEEKMIRACAIFGVNPSTIA